MPASPFQIAILGHPGSWYADDLRRAGHDVEITTVSFTDLASSVDRCVQVHCTADHPSPVSGLPLTVWDVAIVRSMPLGSLEQMVFRMNILHSLERNGTVLINPARCLEVAIDKWLTLDILARSGLRVPRTFCCQNRESAMKAFEYLGRNCVIKPLFGGEGRGILHVTDQDLAWRTFGTLEQLGVVIYLQEFIASPGYDIRILMVGEKSYCVRRQNPNDWRSNVSRGGIAIPWTPTERQREMARMATQAIGGLAIGVDILPGTDGVDYLIEVNAVPGWRATSKALQVDIARELIELSIAKRRSATS